MKPLETTELERRLLWIASWVLAIDGRAVGLLGVFGQRLVHWAEKLILARAVAIRLAHGTAPYMAPEQPAAAEPAPAQPAATEPAAIEREPFAPVVSPTASTVPPPPPPDVVPDDPPATAGMSCDPQPRDPQQRETLDLGPRIAELLGTHAVWALGEPIILDLHIGAGSQHRPVTQEEWDRLIAGGIPLLSWSHVQRLRVATRPTAARGRA